MIVSEATYVEDDDTPFEPASFSFEVTFDDSAMKRFVDAIEVRALWYAPLTITTYPILEPV